MAARIRLIIDTEEELRRAVRIKAARQGSAPSDVINDLIRKYLAREVEEARAAIREESGEEPPPPAERPPRSRRSG